MVVSSTSMNVGMTTAMATTHGLIARRPTRAGWSGRLLMMDAPFAWFCLPGSRLLRRWSLREGGERLQDVAGVGPRGLLLEVDVRGDRQADEQRVPVRVVVCQLDAYRQALDDLDEVAGGVLGR